MINEIEQMLKECEAVFIRGQEVEWEAWYDEDYGGYPWIVNDNTAHRTAEDAVIHMIRQIGGPRNVVTFTPDK